MELCLHYQGLYHRAWPEKYPNYIDLVAFQWRLGTISFTTKILMQIAIQSTCFHFMTLLDVFDGIADAALHDSIHFLSPT
jgi:hypothetical protein